VTLKTAVFIQSRCGFVLESYGEFAEWCVRRAELRRRVNSV
jgi:hypothetical protein